MRKLLTSSLFLLTSILYAYDVEVDGICYNLLGTSMAYVTYRGGDMFEPNGYSGDVVVPSHIVHNGFTYRIFNVGPSAFADCEGLTSVQLPSTVRGVSGSAFLGCTNLRQVALPSDLLGLGGSVFAGCTSLQEVSLPRRLDEVDTLMLYCCASLTSVVLPHRVRRVCQGSLVHLPSMRHLYVFASTPPTADQGAFTLKDQQHCTLHVPREALQQYKQSPIWREFYRIVVLGDADYAAHDYQRGDINDDGNVDAEDLALLRRIVVSLPDDSAVRWAADINGDGKINSVDYVLLSKSIGE
ncbi:MAG: leucine-rich repeat protein [Bacteroidaceae bacterium]|nr:leucine-rich repeat protein [Bacteroidaceae bacterium]